MGIVGVVSCGVYKVWSDVECIKCGVYKVWSVKCEVWSVKCEV